MVEELREQMLQVGDLELEEEGEGFSFSLLGLGPGQRLILAILLLLDVALCGLMALVMMGRIVPPF